jgi:hypothetical protein
MDIKQQLAEVLAAYKSLKYSPENNEFSGELLISDSDSYNVRIELAQYPQFLPNLFETDDRIPKKADRHIYTNTGACCLTTAAKGQILLKTKIKTLKTFIKELVVPYLQNNSYYELNKIYKTDEYPHAGQGIMNGYKDILNITNEHLIVSIIRNRIAHKKLKIHDKCFCQSGNKLKRCEQGKHDRAYREFKLIEKSLLFQELNEVLYPLLIEKSMMKK